MPGTPLDSIPHIPLRGRKKEKEKKEEGWNKGVSKASVNMTRSPSVRKASVNMSKPPSVSKASVSMSRSPSVSKASVNMSRSPSIS